METQIQLEAGGTQYPGIITQLDDSATVGADKAEVYEGIVSATGKLPNVDGASVSIDITLAERGQTRYRIVIGQQAKTLVRAAAEELAKHLQQTSRPDLKIVVMSATLDAAPVAAFLGQAPVISVPGSLFLTPAPTTNQIHSGVTSGCTSCH